MSTLPEECTVTTAWSDHLELLRCPGCAGELVPAVSGLTCAGCDASFPIRDGILVVKEQTDDNNRVAQQFYDSAALAQVPVLGESYLGVQWRRAPAQPGSQAPAAAAGAEAARCGRRRRRLPSMDPSRLAGCGHRRFVVAASGVPGSRGKCPGPTGPVRGREAAFPRHPVRCRAQHRSIQLLQRSRRCAAGDDPRRPSRCGDCHLRRDARLDRPDARSQTGVAGPRSLDRVTAHAPWRQLHRNGRAVPQTERQVDRPRAFCPMCSITKCGGGLGYVLVGRAPG